MKSIITTLLGILAVVTVAGCNEPQPSTCPTCPPPPPQPSSLTWTGVPEDPIGIQVGEREIVTVRLSPQVDAEYSFGTTAPNIAITSNVAGTGVVEVTVVALEVGGATVNLIAEASGYEIARGSFDVVVEREPLFGHVVEGFLACRELADMDQFLEFFQTNVGQDLVDAFIGVKVVLGECGIFEDGDEIRWDGEEVLRPLTGELANELGSDSISVIQIWGTPLIGPEPFMRAPPGHWWIWRIVTTFHEGPRPSAVIRFGVGQR